MNEPRIGTRMVRAVMLAAFLATQPWVVCPALCLVHGHNVAVESTHHHMHAGQCHGDRLTQNQYVAWLQVDAMLPSTWSPVVPANFTIVQRFAPPASLHLDHSALPELPPPRLA